MRYLSILFIKLYWRIIPEKNRNICLFSESCSRYVKRTIENENPYALSGCIKGVCSSYNKNQPKNTKPVRFYIGINKSKRFICKDGYSTNGLFKRYEEGINDNDLGSEKKVEATCNKNDNGTGVVMKVEPNKKGQNKCIENKCENMEKENSEKWELIDDACKKKKGIECKYKCKKGYSSNDSLK